MELESHGPFLKAAHWSAVQAAAERREAADTLASSFWRLGFASYYDGLVIPSGPARETLLAQAEQLWRQSVLLDAGMTDSWLGLLLIERIRKQQAGDRYGDYSEVLAHCPERLFEEQRRYGLALHLDYPTLFSCQLEVKVPDDLRLAHASGLMLAGDDLTARRWVDRCSESHPPTLAGHASLSLRARRWEEALPWCQRLALGEWPELRADGLVGAGMALARLERHEEAELSLQQALVAAVNQAGRLAAHYGLALLYREREDTVRERAELELIACESPDFADVPHRLSALRAADPLVVLRGLEESLRAPAAEDPSIPDNQSPGSLP